jgi:hypothetical protein
MKRTFALLSMSLVLALTTFGQTAKPKANTDCCAACCPASCAQSCCGGACTADCCDNGCACCQN